MTPQGLAACVCLERYEKALAKWVNWAVDFAEFLPAKNKIKKIQVNNY